MMQKKTSDDTYDLAGYVMRLQKDLSDYKHTAVVLQQRLVAAREECEALRAKLNGELEERDEQIRVLNDRISFLSTENMTLRASQYKCQQEVEELRCKLHGQKASNEGPELVWR